MILSLNKARVFFISFVILFILGCLACHAQTGAENARISVNIISAFVIPLADGTDFNHKAVGSFTGSFTLNLNGSQTLTGNLDKTGSTPGIMRAASIAITGKGSYNNSIIDKGSSVSSPSTSIGSSLNFSNSGFLASGDQTLSSVSGAVHSSHSTAFSDNLNISVFYN